MLRIPELIEYRGPKHKCQNDYHRGGEKRDQKRGYVTWWGCKIDGTYILVFVVLFISLWFETRSSYVTLASLELAQ